MLPLKDNVANFATPWMMWLLLTINVFVFLSYAFGGAEAAQATLFAYGTVPKFLLSPGPDPQPIHAMLTLLTSMFLHGGWSHLFGNMFFLYLFGDNVQERMGPWSFLAFYLLCGVLAGLAHVLTNAGSELPAVGASGAISGILGAYLVMFPRAMIRTLILWFVITIIDIPALFFLGFWFVGQLMGGVRAFISPESVGIAFLAHIGGFVAGMLLAPMWPKDRRIAVAYTDLNHGMIVDVEEPDR